MSVQCVVVVFLSQDPYFQVEKACNFLYSSGIYQSSGHLHTFRAGIIFHHYWTSVLKHKLKSSVYTVQIEHFIPFTLVQCRDF